MSMFTIREIVSPDEKEKLSAYCLRALPEWFGVEEATADYIAQSKSLPFFAAYDGEAPAGFLAVKVHTEWAAEVCVMGVLPRYHRRGAGRRLIASGENYSRARGFKYLTVKTLADTHPDEGYAHTRAFYRAMGFVPLEVFPLLWDENNPCLMLIKQL